MEIKKKIKKIWLKFNKAIYRKKVITEERAYIWLFVIVAIACLVALIFSSMILSTTMRGDNILSTSGIFDKATQYAPPNFVDDPMITVGKLRLETDRPLLKITDPIKGDLTAPVVIFEYSDFECKYCAEVQDILDQVMEEYGDKVALIWKDYPVPSIYPNSKEAAIAARCAQEQNGFWGFHNGLFERGEQELSNSLYYSIARDLGLDIKDFEKCLGSEQAEKIVDEDLQEGEDLKIYGVPYFYINDKEIFG